MPVAVLREWGWFLDMHLGRASNGFGPAPLSNLEIWAYCQLVGVQISKRQYDLIRAWDSVALRSITK